MTFLSFILKKKLGSWINNVWRFCRGGHFFYWMPIQELQMKNYKWRITNEELQMKNYQPSKFSNSGDGLGKNLYDSQELQIKKLYNNC
jgi:hypothetical protein